MRTLVAIGVVLAVAACAHSPSTGFDQGTDPGATTPAGPDAAGPINHDDGGPGNPDGAVVSSDAGHDAGADADASTSSGLDPALARPDPGGPTCTTPGAEFGCPSITVCRIDSPSGGRCEGCTQCGNLNAVCSASNQCDILFQCYQGHCTNICPLNTSFCGAITDCINVGNATHGVCRPK